MSKAVLWTEPQVEFPDGVKHIYQDFETAMGEAALIVTRGTGPQPVKITDLNGKVLASEEKIKSATKKMDVVIPD